MPISSLLDMLPSLQEPGKRLVDAGELYEAFQMIFGTATLAGANAPPGPVMSTNMNIITSGPNVSLPPGIPGRMLYIFNDSTGGTTLTVNAQTGQTVGGAASTTQAADTLVQYVCAKAGEWVEIGQPAPPP